jgi:hypothetical protein
MIHTQCTYLSYPFHSKNILLSCCALNTMQVAASFASEGVVMNQIKEWNELYGKGGSRKREQLTYFL